MQQGVIFKDFLKHYILYQKQTKNGKKMSAIEFNFFLKHYILYQSKENGTKKWQKSLQFKNKSSI